MELQFFIIQKFESGKCKQWKIHRSIIYIENDLADSNDIIFQYT